MGLQKRSVFISALICMVTILFVVGILMFWSSTASPKEEVISYEQLAVSIEYREQWAEVPVVERVNIWQDQGTGMYYFFLPSGSENYTVSFGDLSENSLLRIGEKQFGCDDRILSEFVSDQVYEMELFLNGTSLGVQELTFLESKNLATMYIETVSGSVEQIHADKTIKEAAELVLMNVDGTTDYTGNIEYIKTRGNSTFGFEKKPYQIKLKKDRMLLGMPEASRWILLANAVDDTLIKNELVFQYAQDYTSIPSIEGVFVDLYLNGEYRGNYYLCEKVEVHDNRLNIQDLDEATKQVNYAESYDTAVPSLSSDGKIHAYTGLQNPPDITGGYLVEHITASDPLQENSFMTQSGNCYAIVSPEKATMEQAQYICDKFNEMEIALQQTDGIHPTSGKHYTEYIDVESWAVKYVMEETFHDPDAAMLSMFFYKDSDSVDDKIYCGPMWDYDRAIGSYGENLYHIDAPEQVRNLGIYVNEMMAHNEVKQLVFHQFEKYMVPYVEYLASADIYKWCHILEASAAMDRIRWPGTAGYYSSFESGKEYLIEFLKRKVDYLKEVWLEDEEYCRVVFLDYYGNVYDSYSVKKGECLTYAPVIATWVGVFNGWYKVGEDTPYDPRLPVYEDITYQARWIDLDIILQNGMNIAGIDAAQADPQVFFQLAELLEQKKKEALTGQNTEDGIENPVEIGEGE